MLGARGVFRTCHNGSDIVRNAIIVSVLSRLIIIESTVIISTAVVTAIVIGLVIISAVGVGILTISVVILTMAIIVLASVIVLAIFLPFSGLIVISVLTSRGLIGQDLLVRLVIADFNNELCDHLFCTGERGRSEYGFYIVRAC